MRELALFAGIGGSTLAGLLAGWRTVGAVEIDPYCREILLRRQEEAIIEPFPVWEDIRTFDGNPWRGVVDLVTGGFPCQDISYAGKGAGIDGQRSGLWREMLRVVCEVRPRFVFVENVPALLSRGMGRVIGDLAESGYDAEWTCLGADDCGAPHHRKRIWMLAYTTKQSQREPSNKTNPVSVGGQTWDEPCDSGADVPHPNISRLEKRQGQPGNNGTQCTAFIRDGWWQSEPRLGRVVNGCPNRVDRLRGLGNGWVPIVAATAFKLLMRRIGGAE